MKRRTIVRQPPPLKVVYDLSKLSVGDLLRELRARGFKGTMTYIG